jgi:hypothetical protein
MIENALIRPRAVIEYSGSVPRLNGMDAYMNASDAVVTTPYCRMGAVECHLRQSKPCPQIIWIDRQRSLVAALCCRHEFILRLVDLESSWSFKASNDSPDTSLHCLASVDSGSSRAQRASE